MELGDFIFYVVLFGAWLFSFLAKKISTNKTSPEKKGLVLRFLDFIAEFKATAEEQTNSQQTFFSPQRPPISEGNSTTVHESGTFSQTKRQRKSIRAEVVYEENIPPKTPDVSNRQNKVHHKFTQKQMRRAIVWSEILQPPIGLRE